MLTASPAVKAVLSIFATAELLLAFFALLGFIGAVTRKPGLVRAFAVAFLIGWLGGFVLGIVHIVTAFQNREAFLDRCRVKQTENWAGSDATIDFAQKGCEDAFKLFMGVFIAFWSILHCVSLYFVVVAHRGASAIQDEVLGDPHEPKIPLAYGLPPARPDRRRDGMAVACRKGSDASSAASSSATLPVITASSRDKEASQHSGDGIAGRQNSGDITTAGIGAGGGTAAYVSRYATGARTVPHNRQQSLDERLAAGANSASAWGRVSLADDDGRIEQDVAAPTAPLTSQTPQQFSRQAKFSWRNHD